MKFLRRLSEKRLGRLVLSLLLPPVLGTFFLCTFIFVQNFERAWAEFDYDVLLVFPGMLAFVSLLTGVQTLIATCLMEYVLRPLAKRKWHIVLFGVLLGIASASLPFWGFVPARVSGPAIGLVLGWILSLGFEPAIKHEAPATKSPVNTGSAL